MKLYILENEKMIKFKLPQKVEGSFLFTYKQNNIENNLTIDSENNEWKLKSNGNINIMINNEIVDTITLEDYKFMYLANVLENKYVPLYCLPTNDTNAKKYVPIEKITIGKNSNCTITYLQNDIDDNQAIIEKKNDQWYINKLTEKNNIYINEKRIETETELKPGDIIFISGLNIIWMNYFMKINNPNNKVTVKLKEQYQEYEVDNRNYTPVTETENSVQLYNNNEYFFHTPRLKTIIEIEKVKIDTPPGNQNKEENLPIILTMGTSLTLLASSFSSVYNIIYSLNNGNKQISALIPSIVMCVAMLIGSFITPILLRKYQKKQKQKKEELRQKKYTEYLKQKETDIQSIIKKQSNILYENYINVEECEQAIIKKNNYMWNREIKETDFLALRLGIGDTTSKIEIDAPEEHFTLDEDNLYKNAIELKEKYKIMKNIPITMSLIENNISAIIKNGKCSDDFVENQILQLITLHSPTDLKIIILTNQENEKKWKYIKYVPHIFNENKEIRFFAINQEEYKILNSHLEKELMVRKDKKTDENEETNDKEKQYTNNIPYYVIITDSYKDIKSLPYIEKQLKQQKNLGFSILIIDDDMKNLPTECKKFIYISDEEGAIFSETLNIEETQKFKLETKKINMESLCKKLANIPIKIKELETELPNTLSFLEMYNVGKIEQLNVINRWKINNPTISLQAPIGIHKNKEIFKLDLHEKYDGPHGLIAGSTGSGKSEFIITYILSMAINYHPEEVKFVLIDYKGGGLAGAFENRETNTSIPHLAGTITNLDISTMNRTLVSIESELKRRQKKFNEVREQLGESTMDIYKYQKLFREGVIKDQIAHLFIICDEFAELKAQQPDFMQQLISISRIGRSLGVHLILATQKPSGVVNDQIWSNSKFKVCLKVQTSADSMEMLKKPDASSIKETGRFYLQVGYDEYFDIGQSAWSGAKYIPTERIVKKIDDSISFISNIGNNIKVINDQPKQVQSEETSEQLTNIVKYLNSIAQKENIITQKLWLPPLPEIIYIKNIIEKYKIQNQDTIEAIIGEYDEPTNQKQGLLKLNMNENTIIYGIPGSGKENLIETILYSLSLFFTPKDINIYICDFGSEVLKRFQNLPQIGDICAIDQIEKILNLVKMLNKEIERRKKEYIDYGGIFKDYCKYSGKKDSLIIVIINNIEIFKETYSKYEDIFDVLIRDGEKYGIVFVITTANSGSIRSKVANYFQNKICLNMPNDADYKEILSTRIKPLKCYGRGIINNNTTTVEFQTCLICPKEQLSNYIKEYIEKQNEFYKKRVKKIPTLPDIVYVDDVLFELKGLDCMPIGIEKTTLEVYVYDFMKNRTNLITTNNINNHIYFIYALTNQMARLKNVKIKIIDLLGIYKATYPNTVTYNKDFDSAILSMYKDMKEQTNNVYIIIGMGEILNKTTTQNKPYLEHIFNNINKTNHTIIMVDNYEKIKNIQTEEWYNNNVDNTYGIWLGEGVGTQTAISIMSLTLEDKKEIFPCISFPIYKGTHMIVKYVVDGVEKENEQ